MMKNLLEKIFKNDSVNYTYEDFMKMPEKEYPKALKKIYRKILGADLDLKNPKLFTEKIQWLKLYEPKEVIKRKGDLSDKVKVRDFIKETIGEQYLKPLLQVHDKFDEIDFNSLPNKFYLKANHGAKWNYKIKDKQKFLENQRVFAIVKERFDHWLNNNFFAYGTIETQYKDIKPKILVEEIIGDDNNPICEYEVYCFNGKPEFIQKLNADNTCCVWDKNYQISDIKFENNKVKICEQPDDTVNKIVELSSVLAKEFKLVRVDWLCYNGNILFNEMTFTPHSGIYFFENPLYDEQLGNMLTIK